MSVQDRLFVGKTVEIAVISEPKPAWTWYLNVPKTTALLAYDGKMTDLGQDSDLLFLVKDSYFLAVEYWVYSEEGAVNLQLALGKYQVAVEELRSTGEVRGWL